MDAGTSFQDDDDVSTAETEAYGRRLALAMIRAGLTRTELAARSDVGTATVRRLLAGAFVPRIATTLKLAAALGAAPGWLAFGNAPAGFFVVTGALRAQPDRDRSVTWRGGSLSGDPLALLLVNEAAKRAGGPTGPAIFAAQLANPRASLALILAAFEPGAAVLGDVSAADP